MPKYIKKEIADLNGTGKPQACYQMKSEGCMSTSLFLDECSKRGGLQHSTLSAALMMIADELAWQMARGYSVRLDGIGTFSSKLGVRRDMEQDTFEEGERRRNALTVEVSGVSFRVDKELVGQVRSQCVLERGKDCRMQKSPYTLQERIELAKEHIRRWSRIRVAEYEDITGLSHVTAARELQRLGCDPQTGIVPDGTRSAKVYVMAREKADTE